MKDALNCFDDSGEAADGEAEQRPEDAAAQELESIL
jgi:hypothetical protein